MENKQDWEFERSSGYAGYRNKVQVNGFMKTNI